MPRCACCAGWPSEARRRVVVIGPSSLSRLGSLRLPRLQPRLDQPADGFRPGWQIRLMPAPLIDLAQQILGEPHLKTFAEHSRNLRNFGLTRNLKRAYGSYVNRPGKVVATPYRA